MAAEALNIAGLLTPSVEALGYELVHVEFLSHSPGAGKGMLLRLYIDAPGGITVDDCETVSRQVSAILDVEDPIAGEYMLEVSSPGVDRPLVKPEHFKRAIGQRVKVQMRQHHLGRRRFTGIVQSAGKQAIAVEVDGEEYELKIADMDSARLAPEL